mgnify:CR=1 FL=1|jgi:hypothetical protein
MKNDFTSQTRNLFDLGGYMNSWETGISNADCLHHILKRISNSPYNACPLNNFKDHFPEGRKNLEPLHSREVQSKYLIKTKQYLDKIGYKPVSKDLVFLEQHKKYYN